MSEKIKENAPDENQEHLLTKNKLHISVRNLVEFIFREGDIDNRGGRLPNAEAMMEGSRLHRKIQGAMGPGYQAEVPLKYLVEEPLYNLTIEGRADGIFTNDEGIVVIDEIKGIYKNLDYMEQPIYVHQAQAMCYAYIFAKQNTLEQIAVQMTYVNLDTEEKKYFQQEFSYEELEEWFMELLQSYKKWADFQFEWRQKRQESIHRLDFPYEYRDGQKQLVSDVYRTIYRGKKSIYSGTNWRWENDFYDFSSGKGSRRGTGRQNLLSYCKDNYRNSSKGDFPIIRRTRLSGKNDTAHSKGKAMLV